MFHMKPDRQAGMVSEAVAGYGISASTLASETIASLASGLSISEFDALQTLLGLRMEELADHLSMSRSTLMRRRKAGRLDALESDRLLRYARLYGRALQVFGESAAAVSWLSEPARALSYATPLAFAKTEFGAREVENLLGRLEHGVFS
jgi:putative toxin-antitoxin system antitoxin component (TIGR02293 family)